MNLRKEVRKNYSSCYRFLKEIKWCVVFALGIFSFFYLIGLSFPNFFEEQIRNMILELLKSLEGKSTFYLIGFIFLNNLQASFFSFILGISYGIFPFITGAFNGYLLGFVSRKVIEESSIVELWRLLPHGIFELPAILLSIGIGFKIGKDLFLKNKKENLSRDFREGLRFFLSVIVPLLIIAAIIEGLLIGLFR